MTPMHWIGDLLRELLSSIPLPAVRGVFIALPVLLLVWVIRLPNRVTTPEDGKAHWASNLKIWAAVALVVQILIYAWL